MRDREERERDHAAPSARPARPVLGERRRRPRSARVTRDHRGDEVARRQIVGAEGDEHDRQQDPARGDRQRDQRAALLARRRAPRQRPKPDAGEDRQRHQQLDAMAERRAE